MADYYIATDGTSGGDGSIGDPWDIRTGFASGTPGAGDTVYLRGGTYIGRFVGALSGTLGNRVTIRSYPGEWAVLDGYLTTNLTNTINNSTTTVVVDSAVGISIGSKLNIEDEVLNVTNVVGSTLTVVRGWDGTTAVSHTAGVLIWVNGHTLDVSGADATYRDFEIKDSNPNRSFATTGDASSRKGGEGSWVTGTRTQFINLVVHDTQDGFFLTVDPTVEVYGCIIYNNGHVDPNRGNGHGLYIQNQTATKTIKKNISFNNYATGMKAFGESGYANNVTFEKNVSFNNKSPATFGSNPAGYASTDRFVGIEVGTAVQPLADNTITGNYLYNPQDATIELGNLRVGYISTGGTGIVVTNNYIAGGTNGALSLVGIDDATVTGNRLISFGWMASVNTLDVAGITWNNNVYDNDVVSLYQFNIVENGVTLGNPLGGGNIKWTDPPSGPGMGWKEWTGWDASSTYNNAAPTGVDVFVEPNEYETGRATVIAYNWDLDATVPVDLSSVGLAHGQGYEIRNAQNYLASPIATGTYDSENPIINVTTAGLTVAMPIGSPGDFTPASTAPEFCVYEILPTFTGAVTRHYFAEASPRA